MTGRHQSVAAENVFDALSEAHRRAALQTLRRRSTPLELDALAETVADRTTEAAETTETTESEVRASLHHAHLPKLDSLGLVEYDRAAGTVDCEWDPDGVEACLQDAKQVLDGLQQEQGKEQGQR